MLLRTYMMAAVLSAAAMRDATGQTLDAGVVVSKLKGSFGHMSECQFSGKISATAKGWNLTNETLIVESTFRIAASTDFWRISLRTNQNLVKGKDLVVKENVGFDYLLGPEGAISWEQRDGETDSVTITKPGTQAEDLSKSYGIGYLGSLSLVFGFLDGYPGRFLPDLLSKSRVVSRDDSQILLRSESEYGRWEVVVDAREWLPKEMAIEFDEDDFFGSRRISEYRARGDDKGLYPNLDLKSVSRNIQFGSKMLGDGRYAIAGVTSKQRMMYEGGATIELREVIGIDDIVVEPPPENEFRFSSLNIAENTPVQYSDSPQIPYVWRDGRATQYVPEPMAGPLPFRERHWLRRAYLTGNALIVMVLLCVVWWRYRRAQRS